MQGLEFGGLRFLMANRMEKMEEEMTNGDVCIYVYRSIYAHCQYRKGCREVLDSPRSKSPQARRV